jgi:hypothetical protein
MPEMLGFDKVGILNQIESEERLRKILLGYHKINTMRKNLLATGAGENRLKSIDSWLRDKTIRNFQIPKEEELLTFESNYFELEGFWYRSFIKSFLVLGFIKKTHNFDGRDYYEFNIDPQDFPKVIKHCFRNYHWHIYKIKFENGNFSIELVDNELRLFTLNSEQLECSGYYNLKCDIIINNGNVEIRNILCQSTRHFNPNKFISEFLNLDFKLRYETTHFKIDYKSSEFRVYRYILARLRYNYDMLIQKTKKNLI